MHKAVFLDRDNTIIKDDGYFHDPSSIIMMPEAARALQKLKESGFLLVVITNQSGIGRGYFKEADTVAVHEELNKILGESATIDRFYYCPHRPEDNCECRKPKPYLIIKAAKELDIDLTQSFFVGDHIKDMEAGRKAGVKTILLVNPAENKNDSSFVDTTADSLFSAAKSIVSHVQVN